MNIKVFEKRPGAWHLDLRSMGCGRPYGGATEAEARANMADTIARALEARGKRGSVTPGVPGVRSAGTAELSGPTMDEAYKKALTEREGWIQSKAKGTLRTTFEAILANSKGQLSETTPVAILTRDFVRELRKLWLAEPGKRKGTTLSASTINHRLSMLSVLLEVCDLPPHTVKHLSTKGNRRERRISDEEIQKLTGWLRGCGLKGADTLADLIIVALETGARQGELLALPWADVREATLTFRNTKNRLTRTVPLGPVEKAVLEARRALPGGPFKDITDDRITALWDAARDAIGLAEDEQFVFHSLRHEFGSRMADKGENAFTIMALMGHENIKTTEGYVKASLDGMRRARGLDAIALAG